MTEFGLYLAKKSVSKAGVARKTGLSRSRLSELSLNDNTHLRVHELYLVALAIDVDPREMLMELCKDVRLSEE